MNPLWFIIGVALIVGYCAVSLFVCLSMDGEPTGLAGALALPGVVLITLVMEGICRLDDVGVVDIASWGDSQ